MAGDKGVAKENNILAAPSKAKAVSASGGMAWRKLWLVSGVARPNNGCESYSVSWRTVSAGRYRQLASCSYYGIGENDIF